MKDLLHDSTSSVGHVPQGCFSTIVAITEYDVAPTYYYHLQTTSIISRHRLSVTIALQHPLKSCSIFLIMHNHGKKKLYNWEKQIASQSPRATGLDLWTMALFSATFHILFAPNKVINDNIAHDCINISRQFDSDAPYEWDVLATACICPFAYSVNISGGIKSRAIISPQVYFLWIKFQ